LRPDVAAVEDDQILGPAGDHQLAIGQVAEVAGVQPAIRERRGGLFRLAVVLPHQAWPTGEDAAHLALAEHPAGGVAGLQGMVRQGGAAAGEPSRAIGRRSDLGARALLQPADIERLGLQAPAQRRHGQSQGRFGHAVAGHERGGVEAAPGEAFGELFQGGRAHHVAADARGPPSREVVGVQRGGGRPAGAEFVAEGGAEGDAAAVAGDQLQPQQGTPHEGAGGQEVDAHLVAQRAEQEPDQAHVVIERQPGDGAVGGRDPQAVAGDGQGVGHQRAVGDQHPGREARAA
jgi:hypothetical protein